MPLNVVAKPAPGVNWPTGLEDAPITTSVPLIASAVPNPWLAGPVKVPPSVQTLLVRVKRRTRASDGVDTKSPDEDSATGAHCMPEIETEPSLTNAVPALLRRNKRTPELLPLAAMKLPLTASAWPKS